MWLFSFLYTPFQLMSWQLGNELLLDPSNLSFMKTLEIEDLAGPSPQLALMLDVGAQIMGQETMKVSFFFL